MSAHQTKSLKLEGGGGSIAAQNVSCTTGIGAVGELSNARYVSLAARLNADRSRSADMTLGFALVQVVGNDRNDRSCGAEQSGVHRA